MKVRHRQRNKRGVKGRQKFQIEFYIEFYCEFCSHFRQSFHAPAGLSVIMQIVYIEVS